MRLVLLVRGTGEWTMNDFEGQSAEGNIVKRGICRRKLIRGVLS